MGETSHSRAADLLNVITGIQTLVLSGIYSIYDSIKLSFSFLLADEHSQSLNYFSNSSNDSVPAITMKLFPGLTKLIYLNAL